jgi:hypothetical protein
MFLPGVGFYSSADGAIPILQISERPRAVRLDEAGDSFALVSVFAFRTCAGDSGFGMHGVKKDKGYEQQATHGSFHISSVDLLKRAGISRQTLPTLLLVEGSAIHLS